MSTTIDEKVDTATGLLPQSELDRYKKYLTQKDIDSYLSGKTDLEKLKQTISRANFNNAMNYNVERYNKNRKLFNIHIYTAFR